MLRETLKSSPHARIKSKFSTTRTSVTYLHDDTIGVRWDFDLPRSGSRQPTPTVMMSALQLQLRPWSRPHRCCVPYRSCNSRPPPKTHPMSSWWASTASPSSGLENNRRNRTQPGGLRGSASLSICKDMRRLQRTSAWTPHWWQLHDGKKQKKGRSQLAWA